MKHLPNTLTAVRILLTPVFIGLLLTASLRGQVMAFGLFILLAVSDWLDGKMARTYQASSRLGRFLDPLADKILVLSTFVVLPFLIPEVVPWWAVAIIAARDVIVTLLRSWVESHGRSVATLQVARFKTLGQLVFLAFVLGLMTAAKFPGSTGRAAQEVLYGPIPYSLMVIVVALTAFTGIMYLVRVPFINTPAA
jgi:CDP-diacylglycerol--glycerol-3-phosphate 3-phosphatidyltransferase